MSEHTLQTLRRLDAAAPTLSDEQRHRAAETLERIVATPPRRSAPASAPAPGPRRWRLALVPAAVAALALGLIVVQGGGGDRAYASWTPEPSPVSDADLDVVADACRSMLDGSIDLGAARLALAERRGEHVVLLYRTEDPDTSGSCLVGHLEGSRRVDGVSAGAGGSSGPAQLAPPTGFTQGAVAQYQGASITDGAVGEQVVGVTIHAGDLVVEASVEDGRYVAWWPGPAFVEAPVQPSGRGGPELDLRYDLTLADGTVVADAQPTRPE